MPAALAGAHILAQQRLRDIVTRAVETAWASLPSYDERDVEPFVDEVVPVLLVAQRQSVALTEAYLARALERLPLGVNPAEIVGPAARNGTALEDAYRRPFVTVWTALKDGTPYLQAVAAGAARAQSMAATDVQLAMRGTLHLVGEADDRIVGYKRVTDGKACSFCQLVSGQRYRTDQLFPLHAHCGCGVDVITEATRGDFTGNRDNDLSVSRDGLTAEVREHGELGPVLVNGEHAFTQL